MHYATLTRLLTSLLIPSSLVLAPIPSQAQASSRVSQTIVTASQVNGTWKSKTGTFKVWALGNQKLQVEFLGFYEYQSPMGPMANLGTANGIAHIEGDRALFRPQGFEQNCSITLRFTGGKLLVTQSGSAPKCGFGMNVTATGSYSRISNRKPKFGEMQ